MKKMILNTTKEGERIYREMRDVLLTTQQSIVGVVAMNYAITKLMAVYKQVLKEMDMDSEASLDNMIDWWSRELDDDKVEELIPFGDLIDAIEESLI